MLFCFVLTGIELQSAIGKLDHQAALTAALAAERERKPYKEYTGKGRYQIGKYFSENGTATAGRKRKSNINIGESTLQSFKNKYEK